MNKPQEIFRSSDGWVVYRIDGGMGEFDYTVHHNEKYLCTTGSDYDAYAIIGALRFSANMRNSEAHDATVARLAVEQYSKMISGIISAEWACSLSEVLYIIDTTRGIFEYTPPEDTPAPKNAPKQEE